MDEVCQARIFIALIYVIFIIGDTTRTVFEPTTLIDKRSRMVHKMIMEKSLNI